MKGKFRKLSLTSIPYILGIFVLANAHAEPASENKKEYKNIEQMLVSIHWEKKQIESMIDKMIISGRISSEEGKEAKNSIANIQDSDLEKIKTKLIAEVKAKKNIDP